MAQKRKSMGNSKRFKVFERDGFSCQYCGGRPPEVVLHVDHIHPVSKGGTDEIDNLLTSCSNCNAGKAARPLGNTPQRVEKNIVEIQERQEQMAAFYKHQKKLEKLQEKLVDEVAYFWLQIWGGDELSVAERSSIGYFLKFFTVSEIKDAIFRANKLEYPSEGFKYMCGILHNKRREQHGEE